jgi:hypothetical protein
MVSEKQKTVRDSIKSYLQANYVLLSILRCLHQGFSDNRGDGFQHVRRYDTCGYRMRCKKFISYTTRVFRLVSMVRVMRALMR